MYEARYLSAYTIDPACASRVHTCHLPRDIHVAVPRQDSIRPATCIAICGAVTFMSQQLGNEVERQGKANKSTTTTTTCMSQLQLLHVMSNNKRRSMVGGIHSKLLQ